MDGLVEAIQAGHAVYSTGKGIYHYFKHKDDGGHQSVQLSKQESTKIQGKYLRSHIKDKLTSGKTKYSHPDKSLREKVLQSIYGRISSKKKIPRKIIKNMPRNRGYKKKKRTKRYRQVATRFPDSTLMKMVSYHQGDIDPAASGATGWVDINLNDPINPIGTGKTFTMTTGNAEHHVKYWNTLEGLYQKFQTISYKITFTIIDNANSQPYSMFVVPSSTEELTEITALVNDTFTAGTRLKEMNSRAKVRFITTTSETPQMETLVIKGNIRKLEGMRKGANTAELQGTTSASGSELAPVRTPKLFCGLGALASVDLSNVTVIIKIENVILFSALTGDLQGADV